MPSILDLAAKLADSLKNTKKFIILDTNSGGYPCENDRPNAGAMSHGGIWTKREDAEKQLNPIYCKNKETYKVVSIFAESI